MCFIFLLQLLGLKAVAGQHLHTGEAGSLDGGGSFVKAVGQAVDIMRIRSDDDLAAHLVRAVGEPEHRFEEDALRILRLYRFAARFGFAIDPATGAAARALGPHLDCVSAERIQEELLKLLAAPRPGSYLEPAVLAVILPELEPERAELFRREAEELLFTLRFNVNEELALRTFAVNLAMKS